MIAIDGAVLLVLLLGGLAIVGYVGNRRQSLRAAHVPPGVDPGTKAETYYRLCRRMAHELDGVLIRDANLPVLSSEQRATIEDVLREWGKA